MASPEAPQQDPTEESDRVQRRWRRSLRTLAVLLLLAYGLSALLYARSLDGTGSTWDPPVGADAVEVLVISTGLDPSAGLMTAQFLVIAPDSLLDEDGRLTQNLEVTLYPILGVDSLTYAAGSRINPEERRVPVLGQVQNYPFDQYAVDIWASSTVGSGADETYADTVVAADAELVGWRGRAGPTTTVRTSETDVIEVPAGNVSATLTFRRAGSTMAISLLLLTLMVVLAVLAIAVSASVSTQRRKIEATLASWLAAMIFALIPLRTFLPGAPPIGSWIDILVFFWVEVALMVALGSFILSWLRMGPRPDRPQPPVPGPAGPRA